MAKHTSEEGKTLLEIAVARILEALNTGAEKLDLSLTRGEGRTAAAGGREDSGPR
jgi:hypothetical protein